MNASNIFELIQRKGEGNYDDYSVYFVRDDDDKIYRVDCGDSGSFEIAKMSGEEEYNIKLNEWIWIEGEYYRYTCLSSTYSGYPILPIKKAWDIVNK